MAYFDHAATTPMHAAVIPAMTQIMEEVYGNPSSIHQHGRKAHEHLESARQAIAKQLQVKANEIIFTSGGTEGDNLAITGTAFARQKEGKHLITTMVEHPAVLNTMKYLETQGFEVTYLPVDEQGQITADQVQAALKEETILVSIMYANNETGVLFPIQEIGALLANHPATFHTDAVQVYGKIPLRPKDLSIDLLSIAAHKINGPKGVGFLFQKEGTKLTHLIRGGAQEEKRRAGTENLAGIVGMRTAIELLTEEQQQINWETSQQFSDYLLERFIQEGVQFSVNGGEEKKLSHILNLRLPGVPSNLLLMHLDLQGFSISTGSACSAGDVEPSHVLEAMHGEGHQSLKESIRISFGYQNTQEEVVALADALIAAVKRLKKD
ncbi:cysteine desulfurase family protein [Enterococcus sp. LJL98]